MSYRVAVTTSDGENIDQHFGMAASFLIIEINEEEGVWKEMGRRFVLDETDQNDDNMSDFSSQNCSGHFEPHLNRVVELLKDCSYLLTERIGRKPYKVLQQNGINSLESPRKLSLAVEQLTRYLGRLRKK